MKTHELIAQLQEADPSGQEEVSVGNVDIHFVSREPAYWDGCVQVLKRAKQDDGYNIIGAEIRSEGEKIKINILSIKSALWNDPKMPVTFDGERTKKDYEEIVQSWRDEAERNDDD